MNSDFWKRFPPIPGFDCIKMKRDIQAKIHEETKDMTLEEKLEYYRRGAKELYRRRRPGTRSEKPLTVKEEAASYGAKKPRRKG